MPLTFASNTCDPSAVRIALSSGLSLAPAVFAIASGDPEPRDVSTAIGPVVYTIGTGGRGVSGHLRV